MLELSTPRKSLVGLRKQEGGRMLESVCSHTNIGSRPGSRGLNEDLNYQLAYNPSTRHAFSPPNYTSKMSSQPDLNFSLKSQSFFYQRALSTNRPTFISQENLKRNCNQTASGGWNRVRSFEQVPYVLDKRSNSPYDSQGDQTPPHKLLQQNRGIV